MEHGSVNDKRKTEPLKTTAILLYRSAVLLEKSERLYVKKLQMECGMKIQARSKELHLVAAQNIRKLEEDIALLRWEMREIERMVPDTARYAA